MWEARIVSDHTCASACDVVKRKRILAVMPASYNCQILGLSTLPAEPPPSASAKATYQGHALFWNEVKTVACPCGQPCLHMGSVRDRRRKVPWKNEPSMLKLVCRSVQSPDATNSLQGLKLSNQGPPRSNDDSGQACLDNNALERAALRTSRFNFASAALPVCEDSCGIHTSIAITSGKLW